MSIMFLKNFFDLRSGNGEIIPFPVYNIPFPVSKIFSAYFGILRSNENEVPKEVF